MSRVAVGQQDPSSAKNFFNEIINHPVPLDMNTLTAHEALSALGLDLYMWVAYRTFTLESLRCGLAGRASISQFGVRNRTRSSDKRHRSSLPV